VSPSAGAAAVTVQYLRQTSAAVSAAAVHTQLNFALRLTITMICFSPRFPGGALATLLNQVLCGSGTVVAALPCVFCLALDGSRHRVVGFSTGL
jgi:hypothetical protein